MAPGAVPLVLASGSATRRALLEAAGLVFSTVAPGVHEAAIKRAMRDGGAAEAALALANAKAEAAGPAGGIVIGADQILVCGDDWFDKPADLDAARVQLQRLRGRRHELITAVTCWRDGQPVWHDVARPALCMRAVSDAFLDAYVAAEGDAVLASVGAYRIEGLGIHLFEAVQGEHAAILGLPLLALLGFLRRSGVLID